MNFNEMDSDKSLLGVILAGGDGCSPSRENLPATIGRSSSRRGGQRNTIAPDAASRLPTGMPLANFVGVPETKGKILEQIEAHWRAGKPARAL